MRTGIRARWSGSMPALEALTTGDAAGSSAAVKANSNRMGSERFRRTMEISVGKMATWELYPFPGWLVDGGARAQSWLANLQAAHASGQHLAWIEAIFGIEQHFEVADHVERVRGEQVRHHLVF